MENDDAYANAAHIPDGAAYPDLWAERAQQFRSREAAVGRARLNQPYGSHPRERFDLFYPAGRPAGLVVVIHGGFWLEFGREDFSHLAQGATGAGWACALPSYPLAPEARIAAITRAVAAAVGAAAALVPGPIAVSGHSAGGHLAARMMGPDIGPDVAPAWRARLTACVPVSPLGDLRPLRATSMNARLRLDAPEAASESPVLHPPLPGVPVTVVVGAAERPAFIAQARGLAAAWAADLLKVPGRHHFDVIEGYEDATSPLVAALTAPRRA